jgi:hypothetical protein
VAKLGAPMWREIYDNPHIEIVFSTEAPVLCSFLVDGAFAKVWKKWKRYLIQFREDATVAIRKTPQARIKHLYRFEGVVISELVINDSDAKSGAAGADDKANSTPGKRRKSKTQKQKEKGLLLCCKDGNFDARFRCILSEEEAEAFFSTIKAFVNDYHVHKKGKADDVADDSDDAPQRNSGAGRALISNSAMRSSVTTAMDFHDDLTRRRHIVDRRGALKFLPPLFANDLVHGSWLVRSCLEMCLFTFRLLAIRCRWFTIGSAVMLGMSIMILVNNYYIYIGNDDSELSPLHTRACWGLMAISGFFFTTGSLAFVRATHESPPMRPLFEGVYHLQNDELLASWNFLIATFPYVPYFLIYLAHSGSILYIG